ncbi:MAG: carboxypeptidase regulatory-like domain-containing protein [Acidobacteriaceae bacterium]
MTLRLPSLLILSVLLVTGCKHPQAPAAKSPSYNPAPAVNPATAGEISGIVHFDGPAPPRVPIDMSADPACNKPGLPNLTEQIIVNDGALANVYVYIKSGAPSYTAIPDAPPVNLDQKGCRYIPHVLAIHQGGAVAFLNSDATTHNIHTLPTKPGNASVDISEPPDSAARVETFPTPEVMLPVRCNNHPWMSAFINIAPNPWYAVSNTDGTFRITGVPPGTYTLAAVQEKLGEKDIQITVKPKSVADASFTFTAK